MGPLHWALVSLVLAIGCGSPPPTASIRTEAEVEAAPPAPLVLSRPAPEARDTVASWTFAEVIPLQEWATLPRTVIGLLSAAGEQPWGVAFHHAGGAAVVAGRTEYRFTTGPSSPWALYFVSDGRGENFLSLSEFGRAYDVAMFGPDTPNEWGLGGPAHLVALSIEGWRDPDVIEGVHLIATDVRVLDGTEGYPPDVTATLVALRRLFDARLEEDAVAIEAVARADVEPLVAATPDATDHGEHSSVALHPSWDAERHRLVVVFFATRFAAREVLREAPFHCPPGAPCAPPRPPEPEILRAGAQLAVRYEVDPSDTVVRETTFAPLPLAPAPPPGY